MRKLKSFALAALALAAAFVTSSVRADTDELGLTPKHWYKFDGNNNSSGANTLTRVSGSTYEDALDGKALCWTGGSSYGENCDFGGNDFTLFCVAKAKQKSNANDEAIIFSSGDNSGSCQKGFALTIKGASTIAVRRFGVASGWAQADIITTTVDDACAAYHCYAIVYTESDNTIKLYVDGALAGSDTSTPFQDYDQKKYQFNRLYYGNGYGMVDDDGMYCDDLRVYQQGLAEEQVRTVTQTFVDLIPSRAYVWAPQNGSTDWNAPGNWMIGEDDATEPPTAHDTVTIAANRAGTIKIPEAGVTVKSISIDKAGWVLEGGAITLAGKGAGSTIKGTATLAFDGGFPDSSVEASLKSSDWKGQIWIRDIGGNQRLNFNEYANANSTIKLSGVQGWIYNQAKTQTPAFILEDEGCDYSLNIHDGSADQIYTFNKISGAGKILGDGNSNSGYLFKDASEFTGSLEALTKTFTFGTDGAVAGQNKIVVRPNTTMVIGEGKTWKANGGIQIDGTISGSGMLLGAVTFGLNATLDASGAELLTANAVPTFALTNRFAVTVAPTDGSPVRVLKADGAFEPKTLDGTPVVVVGGAEVDGTFQIKAAADGIYLEKVTGNFAIESDKVSIAASELNAQLGGADGSSIVTVKLTGDDSQELVLDASIKGGDIKIVHTGMLTIKADEKPADFAKYDLRGVDGFIRYSWLAMKRVINLNFRDTPVDIGAGSFTPGDMSSDGLLAGNTPKASWINLGNDASASDVAVTNVWNVDTFVADEIQGMTIGWDASTVYQAGQTIPVLKGYLDDGNADGVKITLKGVPFATYDVIVYYNTDMDDRVYPAVKVNGAPYTWDTEQGGTVAGGGVWGSTCHDGVAYGVNALRIPDIVGDAVITTAKRDDGQSLRACVPAIQIVEVEAKEVVNSYEAEGDADVRVSYLNQIVTQGYAGGFTLTLHGGALIFDEPFVCAALTVNSTGDLTITTGGATISETELAKIVLNDVAGVVTYGFAVSPLATTLNGVVYTVGVGTEETPAPISYVANGSMTLKGDTFYIGTTYSGTLSTVNFVDATIYGLGDMGFGVGNETFNLYGTTTVESEKFILSQGQAGRVSYFTMNDESSVTITGSSIVDSNQSSIMFGHWNGPSTFTMNNSAVFDATNAQVLVGKTSNAQTININGGTFIAKGIKASSGASGVNTLNWTGGELKLGEYGITSYNANRITVNVTNEVTLTATAETIPLSQPIAGPGTIRKQGDGVLELTSSLADFTGKIVADPEDVISLTNNVLPLAGGMLTKIEGTVMINAVAGENFFKICEGVEVIPENLTILGLDDQEIAPLCVVGGDLYYGNAKGEFELTGAEILEVNALSVGGVYTIEKPTLYISETCTNLPEGFGWKREGATIFFFKKSNSISYKFGTRTDNKASAILSSDTDVGGFPVAGVVWNNGRIWNGNNAAFNDYVKLMDGNGEMTEATLAYRAPNTYFNKDCPLDSGNQRLTSTYLDDGADAGSTTYTNNYSSQGLEIPEGGIVLPAAPNARGWEMKLSDIPYEMFDLYVYIASDQPQDGFKGCPVVVSIDGEKWTYYAGAKIGSDSSVWTPDVYSKDGTVTEGKNYIRFRISKASMQAEDISTIYLTHGTRNTGTKKRIGLAGIQIVEIDDDGVRNYVGTGDWVADDAWQTSKGESVEWKNVEDGEVLTAIINADTHDAITINSNVVATTVKLIGGNAEKVFTIAGYDYALTATTIDATLFSGTLNLYAPILGPIALGPNCAVVLNADGALDAYEFSAGRVIIPVYDTRTVTIPVNLASEGVEVVAKDGATVQLAFGDGVAATGYAYPTKVVVEEGGVLDLAGFKDYSYPIVLAGGTLKNSGGVIGENTRQYWQMSVISNSTIDVSGNMYGSVASGKANHNFALNGSTITKTGAGEYYISNATFDSGKFVVSEGLLVLDQFTIAAGQELTVEVADGATLKLAGTQSGDGKISIINNGGSVDLQTSVTVGDFLGTGTTTIADNVGVVISGTADYPIIPEDSELADGATIRLAAGLNVLNPSAYPLSALGAVTLDAEEGARLKGKGTFLSSYDEPTMTEAFVQALKDSGRMANIVTDEDGAVVVEIEAIPRFLLMLK